MRRPFMMTRGSASAAMTLGMTLLLCGLALPAHAQQPGASPTTSPTTNPTTSAPAQAQHEERAVTLLLSAHHELPSRAAFEQASPRARQLLLKIAADKRAFTLHRARTLEALGRDWQEMRALPLYEAMLQEAGEGLKHRLLMSAARGFGAAALGVVSPYLATSDALLRETAIEALAPHAAHEPVRQALRQALKIEQDARLKQRLWALTGQLR